MADARLIAMINSSVGLSVRPPRSRIMSKRMHMSSNFFTYLAIILVSFESERLYEIPRITPSTSATYMGKILLFSTNIAAYLGMR